MLELREIKKEYTAGDTVVQALKGVSIAFRNNEFVSILGPSGCGKTTLLNLIGGLDRYSGGDLIINGRSTKEYNDGDWDTYRNHSVGFVFQNYNLIPHQTVLANVELAMTLTGVSKEERRKRAAEALERVGLGDQLKKRPNQMSGGQMQRVAIARALVNDPDILLADEPTGALDTETSVQIMDLLKEVARDRLVIMVTHNPELAEAYSTRIIRLLDGKVIGDTDPYAQGDDGEQAEAEPKRLSSMSFGTALGLSLRNLLTKKGRTLLTAFAGSIGIIGIALILSLSNGIQAYIDRVQEDTLSSYPLSIQSEEYDLSGVLSAVADSKEASSEHDRDAVYSNSTMADLMDAMLSVDTKSNDLAAFNDYLLSEESGAGDYITTIQYTYDIEPLVYSETANQGGLYRVNPSSVFDDVMDSGMGGSYSGGMSSMFASSGNMKVWSELIDNQTLLESQYEVLTGHWPEKADELILVLDENNEVNDYYLYALGLKDPSEVADTLTGLMKGETIEAEQVRYSYEEILNTTFRLLLPTDTYQYDNGNGSWNDMQDNDAYMEYAVKNGMELRFVGIIRPKADAVATAVSGAVGYTKALTDYIIDGIAASDVVSQQLESPETDVLSGLPFDDGSAKELTDSEKAAALKQWSSGLTVQEQADLFTQLALVPDPALLEEQTAQMLAGMDRAAMEAMLVQGMAAQMGMDETTVAGYLSGMSDDEVAGYAAQAAAAEAEQSYAEGVQQQLAGMTEEEKAAMLPSALEQAGEETLADLYDSEMPAAYSDSTCEDNLKLLGYTEKQSPSGINIYAASFEAKDKLVQVISDYNDRMTAEGKEEEIISYTDYVGLLMSSITKIINIISYVLIGFVSISLIVSSIMIGIITYISVLERTKEIGILRSIGASKRDVSRVFTAETLIIGFVSGLFGIGITLLLNIPISLIVKALTDVPHIALLPAVGGAALVLISMLLTFVAGLVPSRMAAKKDPVEALRTE